MTKDEAVVSEKRSKTSVQLLSAEQRLLHPEPPDEPPGGDEYPAYVTLRKGTFIHCPKANMYIHIRGSHEKERQPVTGQSVHTCADGPDCDLHCSGNEFLNQSYVPQAEPPDGFKCRLTGVGESGNLYTNLSCTWSSLTLFWFYFFLQVCSFSVTQVTVNWYSRGPHNVCTTRFCRDISWKCPENLESLTSQAGQIRLTSHLDHERSDLMEFLSNTSGWRWEQHRIGVWCNFEPDE